MVRILGSGHWIFGEIIHGMGDIQMEKQDANSTSTFGLFAGVFLLSAAVLSFEILASRISAIVLVHNYAFMVVSLAVLGLGCGGIFSFYRWRTGKLGRLHQEFSLYSSLFAVSVSLFIVLVTRAGFAASRFPYFLILFIPFFFAGVVLSLAFRSFAHKSFKLYAADLIGAAFGSISAIWILSFLGGINGVLFIGILGSIASFSFLAGRRGRLSSLKIPALLSSLCVLLFLTNILTSFLGEVPIGRYPGKDLHNILSNPLLKAEIVESRWSTFGRTDLMRYKDNENVMLLFIDGAAGTAMNKFSGDPGNPGEYIERLMANSSGFFPFSFLRGDERDDMLIIGPGGGTEVLFGLLADVKNITGVEVNQDLVDIVKEYKDYNGGIYSDFENVDIVVDEGRSFLRDSDQKYDIIMSALPVTKGSRSPEGYALTENYLFTVESIKDYLDHLTDEGRMIVVMHNWYETLRLTITALVAFEEMGIETQDAMKHIYTLGRDMNPLLVLKKTPFTPGEAEARHNAMHVLGFDTPLSSYIPHIEQQTALHEMEEGAIHEISMFNQIMVALSEGSIELNSLVAAMPHNVSPATDDKPFFFKAEIGLPDEISSLLWLIILVNVLVIAVPAIYKRVSGNLLRALALLMLLGAGFMMIEISFFQRLTLYLGSSTISLAVLLSSLLVGMGIGSFLGGKVYPDNSIRRLKIASSGVFLIAILLFFVHPLILNNLLGSGILVKSIVSAALLVPLGFILGIPFPTAISWLKEIDAEDSIAWMYGVNGTMSVLGSVAAIAVSLTFGFSVALILGALCYLAIVFIYF